MAVCACSTIAVLAAGYDGPVAGTGPEPPLVLETNCLFPVPAGQRLIQGHAMKVRALLIEARRRERRILTRTPGGWLVRSPLSTAIGDWPGLVLAVRGATPRHPSPEQAQATRAEEERLAKLTFERALIRVGGPMTYMASIHSDGTATHIGPGGALRISPAGTYTLAGPIHDD